MEEPASARLEQVGYHACAPEMYDLSECGGHALGRHAESVGEGGRVPRERLDRRDRAHCVEGRAGLRAELAERFDRPGPPVVSRNAGPPVAMA